MTGNNAKPKTIHTYEVYPQSCRLGTMKNWFVPAFYLMLVFVLAIPAEKGTRAKTMRNQTQRTPHNSAGPPPPASRPPPGRPSDTGSTRPSGSPGTRPGYSDPSETGKAPSDSAGAASDDNCTGCSGDDAPADKQRKFETAQKTDFLTNTLSVNSRVAFTRWDFNFSPAIQHQSIFFPTYELEINAFGLEFSYLTALPPQPDTLFREIPVFGQENTARNSVMEYLKLAALPLTFMENPLLKNLVGIEFRKTTKSTTVTANQKLYYFPYTTYPGLTEQDSDLGLIFYEQKAAGTKLSYNIKERDWLITVGLFALRFGYFDVAYSKPYQMDADIYQGDVLIDRRVYLFEGQATGRGLMIGLQNLYFPNWDTRRFYFASPETLADGFFWGLKELGFYWGSGSIRLQNDLDLVEKYRAFYVGETGHQPSVSFLRQIFHAVIGYKFNRHFKIFAEYRYANYSLTLKDSYSDDTYNYFLSHAINRDTIQQFAINLTIGF